MDYDKKENEKLITQLRESQSTSTEEETEEDNELSNLNFGQPFEKFVNEASKIVAQYDPNYSEYLRESQYENKILEFKDSVNEYCSENDIHLLESMSVGDIDDFFTYVNV